MSWQADAFLLWFHYKQWRARHQTFEEFLADHQDFPRRVAWMLRVPRHCSQEAISIGNIPCEWIVHRSAAQSQRVILYFHGGAFVMGGTKTHYGIAGSLSEVTCSKVLLVDYRVMPPHPYPAAHDDALASYRYLLGQHYRPEHIVLAGDSAGGNLVLSTLVRIRDQELPRPAAGLCFSPWVDLSHSSQSFESNRASDPLIDYRMISRVATLFAHGVALDDPGLSPAYADLHGLPPIYFNVSSTEVLLDDVIRITDKARASGVTVQLSTVEKVPHAFSVMTAMLPEARASMQEVAAFLRQHTVAGRIDATQVK